MTYKLKQGFTLIELLVVIAIIGVLAALVTASINDSRAKSRDAARISQLKELSTALELYYLDNDAYPTQNAAPLSGISSDLVPQYIRSLPSDPLFTGTGCNSADNSDYCYHSTTGQGFVLLMSHEGTTGFCKIAVDHGGWGAWPDCESL